MKTELQSPSPLRDLAEQLATGATTPIDVAEAALARIADLEPEIHAWAHLDADAVRSAAARIQVCDPRECRLRHVDRRCPARRQLLDQVPEWAR